MKTVAVTLLVIFLVLTVVTTSVASRGLNEVAVLDSQGLPVKPLKPYLIQPAGQPDLWVYRNNRFVNVQCPQAAVLSSSFTPIVFMEESGLDYVPLNTSVSIRFEWYDPCPESSVWRVGENSPFPAADITASGTAFTPASTFKIQNDNGNYKFVYESQNVGVFTEPATQIEHLVLDPTPLNVIFVSAYGVPGHKTSGLLKTMVPFMY